jgi:dissimilatory sulfite reductase related protein
LRRFDMPVVEFKGKRFMTDESGFLQNYENWSDEWVEYIKQSEGIQEITEEHWSVMNVIREYYERNGIAPMIRVLSKRTGCTKERFWELWPSGPGDGACKMAGLAKPAGCV